MTVKILDSNKLIANNNNQQHTTYPLTHLQKDFIFSSNYADPSHRFINQFIFHLNENVNSDYLIKAIQKVSERHEILRSAIIGDNQQSAKLCIYNNVAIPFKEINLEHLILEDATKQCDEIIAKEMTQEFDIHQAPLTRFTLIKCSENKYQLVWSYHPIIVGGNAINIVINEIFSIYDAYCNNKDVQLLPSGSYQRHIDHFIHFDHARAITHWRQLLLGFKEPNSIILPKPTLTNKKVSHEKLLFNIPLPLITKIKDIAEQYNLTVNAILQAAWGLLISYYTNENDIVFGAKRAYPKSYIENMVGYFVNTLPIRMNVSSDQNILNLVENLRQQHVELRKYISTSLTQIRDCTDIPETMPLFETVFDYRPHSFHEELTQSENNWQSRYCETDIFTNYPLLIQIHGEANHLQGRLYYSTQKFSQEYATRFIKHFTNILTAMTEDIHQQVETINPLTNQEVKLILQEWNNTTIDYNQTHIIELIQQQAKTSPNATAIIENNYAIDYQTFLKSIQHYANAILNSLTSSSSEQPIAICLPKNKEFIYSLFAAIYLGYAYVPIDPSYPKERIDYIIENCNPSLIITNSKFKAHFAEHQYLDIDNLDKNIIKNNIEPQLNFDRLAYIIYTSGSTGKPKGVAITQNSLHNCLNWLTHQYQFKNEIGILKSSISFDASVWEIFTPLFSQGTLVIADDDSSKNALEIINLFIQHKVTISLIVPSLLRIFLEIDEFENTTSLKHVFVGAESISQKTIDKFHQSHYAKLHNLYGPTEATIFTTAYDFNRKDEKNIIPMGKPIANTQVYVLNQNKHLLPIGVTGELYIAGTPLAREYYNNPSLTETTFTKLTLPDNQYKTIYKTGDLVRWLEDGNLEFINRKDMQIKLHGFRIEIAEIESIFLKHPAIDAVVIQFVNDNNENPFLAAFIVTNLSLTILDIRNYLKSSLPYYMIPQAIQIIKEIPLTANGKINYKALPKPNLHSQNTQQAYLAPRTHNEKLLCEIFSYILQVKKISLLDNFFELGGNSLKTMQLITHIRTHFNIILSPKVIFDHSTISNLLHYIEQNHENIEDEITSIKSNKDLTTLALSLPQERLYFLQQLDPKNDFYNEPLIYQLQGILDKTRLEQALNEIIARHEILRTTFHHQNGQVYQEIHPELKISLNLISLKKDLDETIAEIISQYFNLNTLPLLKVSLINIDDETHVLIINMHHIICDGWSIDVLFNELNNFYSVNKNHILPLSYQYKDFALWQKQYIATPSYQTQLKYWQTKLHDSPTLLQLPADKPRPATLSYRGELLYFKVEDALYQELQNKVSIKQSTLFSVLLSVFYVLIYRYTQQTDILVGTFVANRTLSEIENLIGFFVNTLVLRVNIDKNQNFDDLLTLVQNTMFEALAHQNLPFEKLIETIHPERSLDANPIIQVCFALENVANTDLRLGDIHSEPYRNPQKVAKFDLTLTFKETAEGLEGVIEYSTDLFHHDRMVRFKDHYINLLQQLITNSQQSISFLPYLTQQESTAYKKWNQQQKTYPTENTIVELFNQQVAKTPNKLALEYYDIHLTYKELQTFIQGVSSHLTSLNVKAEQLITISLPRSHFMIAALNGVLQAGCAYLPIDPSLPVERIKDILEDSQSNIVITTKQLFSQYENIDPQLTLLNIEEIVNTTFIEPNIPQHPNHLAYIIYTSGSTGKPKGVLVEHQSALNTIFATIDVMDFNSQSRVLQFSSISFDVSVSDIFASLLTGATLVMTDREDTLPGEYLANSIKRFNITHGIFPPVALANTDVEGITTLRAVMTAGDVCTQEIVNKWQPICRFFNGYGPTEISIYATFAEITSTKETITIGKPLNNTSAYILDQHQQFLPFGVSGELYVGGKGVTRGYLNRDNLTKLRFINNPFKENDRLYRTGDLAFWDINGNINFIGRIDNQIKLRGYRIELGEIEKLILEEETIEQAIVIKREDEPNYPYLAAYIIASTQLDIENLRAALLKKLPNYMVPSTFTQLEKYILNTSGKVDKSKLPKPEKTITENQVFIAPTSEVEIKLAEIWSSQLNIIKVGVEDNFFMLGGHSLLATKLISKINQTFKSNITIKSLFDNPTIKALANMIENSNQDKEIAQIHHHGITKFNQSYQQQQLWLLDQINEDKALYNMPSALEIKGPIILQKLEASLHALMARHPSLRTRFNAENLIPIQQIIDKSELHLTTVETDLASLKALIQAEIHSPFDFTNDCLFRVTLFKLTDSHFILLFNLPHIISDGWSQAIMLRDFLDLYADKTLPNIQFDYIDYTIWQQQQLSQVRLQPQIEYWQSNLQNNEDVLTLPYDNPKTNKTKYQGQTHYFIIDEQTTSQLKTLAKEQQCTLFALTYTLFTILMHKYSGLSDFLIGTPLASRKQIELQTIIGYFVNVVVLKTKIDDKATLQQLLQQQKNNLYLAFENGDVPFEKLVEIVQPERDTNNNPLFQVMFAYQENEDINHTLDNTYFQQYPLALDLAKFDLTFTAINNETHLRCEIEYNSDLYQQSTIELLQYHFITLTNYLLKNSQQTISQASLMDDNEFHKVMHDWNNTKEEFPSENLQARLEFFAKTTPDNIAIIYEDKHLTYDEFNQLVNHYAKAIKHALPENTTSRIISVFLPRSEYLLAALYAIIKLNYAFIALDAKYPSQRVDDILEDSGSCLIITDEKHQSGFLYRLPQLTIEQINQIPFTDLTNPPNITKAKDLAYLIYTSGTTGKPKGITISHEAMLNHKYWYLQDIKLQPDDTFVLNGSISFDGSHTPCFASILAGSKLVIANENIVENFERLLDLLIKHQVTIIDTVPSLIQTLILFDQFSNYHSLRHLVFGGEALPLNLVTELQKISKAKIHNHYGPSETTVEVTCHIPSPHQQNPNIPIGQAIANTEIYILNKEQQLQPIGIAGEIYIGGVCLANGYYRNETLTDKAFVTVTLDKQTKRLYKTGDLGRRLCNGDIEFLGRIDNQIKLRGFRIEIGEIEAKLVAHPKIKQAVVTVVGDKTKFLASYFTLHAPCNIAEIKTYLEQQLPHYMVPSTFDIIDEIPISSTGKIDNKKLPPPTQQQEEIIMATTTIEREISHLFAKLLNLDTVSINHSFFEMGGNSLLATQLILIIKKQYDIKLPIKLIFQQPTVKAIANYIETNEIVTTLDDKILQDTKLNETIKPCEKNSPNMFDPKAILLTGATGFLGAFLVNDLLIHTEATIYCLVRANNLQQAESRLLSNLKQYQLPYHSLPKRIKVLVGDLSQEKLGLSSDTLNELSEVIDSIYHNGAYVHSTLPYQQLYTSNVQSTLELIKFACHKQNKAIHYVSTISAVCDFADNGDLLETPAPNYPHQLENGYPLTKWVSERLINQIGQRGLPITIYRPGTILGHSLTGAANKNDSLTYLVNACLQMKKAPDWQDEMPMSCVDYVSSAIIHLSLNKEAMGQTFHLNSEQVVTWLDYISFYQQAGLDIEIQQAKDWQQHLVETINPANPLYKQLSMYLHEENSEASPHHHNKKTIHHLTQLGLPQVLINQALIKKYL